MPIRFPRRAGILLKTRQTSCYHVGDDGDYEPGIAPSYTVLSVGQYAGTTNIDSPHYATNGISFTAPSTISDAGAGLVTVLTGDTIRVYGSALNDGIYTVAAGGVAGAFTVNEITIQNELAGAYITLAKRASPSNNAVLDNITGLMWKRYTTGGPVEKVGAASVGALNWYDATTCFTLHPAAGDLQMMATGIKIIGGAGEISRYFVGQTLVCSGFANPVNNLPGYRVTGVVVNGADLDITLWRGNNILIAEAAAGARDIKLVCRSVFSYCAAANAASFAGYTDWRIPTDTALFSLRDMEQPSAAPDAVAFPSWPTAAGDVVSSTSMPQSVTRYMTVQYDYGIAEYYLKAVALYCALVRGGKSA